MNLSKCIGVHLQLVNHFFKHNGDPKLLLQRKNKNVENGSAGQLLHVLL